MTISYKRNKIYEGKHAIRTLRVYGLGVFLIVTYHSLLRSFTLEIGRRWPA